MMSSFKLGKSMVGLDHKPYIIAEMSGNHNQSLERALLLVEEIAKTGADALKLQTYTADTMTLDLKTDEFYVSDPKNLWYGKTLYELYDEAHTPWEWHKEIFEKAKSLGMDVFSTPFDETAVDFLETLEVPFYKIASFENTDEPLIKKVASTGKPMVISTGMATLSELDNAVRIARDNGCKNLVLLKCTSTYPANPTDSNIATIPHLRELFNCEVGLSDHSMGVGVSVASIALGATVIEKHFTLDRNDGGVDSAFSMEPDEFASLVIETERAWQSIGCINYGPTKNEEKSRLARRSIYIVKDVEIDEVLTSDNLKAIRPGIGLPPKHIDVLLGKRVKVKLKKGTPMKWDYIE